MPSPPFELVSGPVTVFLAPWVTQAPDVSDPPVAPWQVLGLNGALDYDESGLTISPDQTIEQQMVLGSTAPQKAFRTEEQLTISVTLVEITVETLAIAMSGAPITDIAAAVGVAGARQIELLRGFDIQVSSVLVKGFSPYGGEYGAQYWMPRAYVSDLGEWNYTKGDAVSLEMEFTALQDVTHGFGTFTAQTAPPL